MRQAEVMRSANCSCDSTWPERCRPWRASRAFHHGMYLGGHGLVNGKTWRKLWILAVLWNI